MKPRWWKLASNISEGHNKLYFIESSSNYNIFLIKVKNENSPNSFNLTTQKISIERNWHWTRGGFRGGEQQAACAPWGLRQRRKPVRVLQQGFGIQLPSCVGPDVRPDVYGRGEIGLAANKSYLRLKITSCKIMVIGLVI